MLPNKGEASVKRAKFVDLRTWLNSNNRKPLVIRGARQVGKTWIVRQLAESAGLHLIELNFEDQKQDVSLFRTNDPQAILNEIGASRNIDIEPSSSLLFLDEIQSAPELLAKLRWFAEKMPELAVIATGSLLDFALDKHTFSMPVGRISYFYLEPLSFEEFLVARNQTGLFKYITEYTLDNTVPEAIHIQIMTLFKEFMIIGGLPSAVDSWINEQSLIEVSDIHNSLLSSFHDDFGKYRGRLAIEKLEDVLASIPKQLAQKFVYKQACPNANAAQVSQALSLLNKARVTHKVISTHSNGIPLAAQTNDKFFKEIFLDVGLCSAQLGLTLNKIQSTQEINLINKGGIAEQTVGQILRTTFPYYLDPKLYCWMREARGSAAEIDYVIQHNSRVIPVEVKAGKTGTLRSLHYFMGIKNYQLGVRVNSDYPSIVEVNVNDASGKTIQYKLLSIPFYLVGQINRLIEMTE